MYEIDSLECCPIKSKLFKVIENCKINLLDDGCIDYDHPNLKLQCNRVMSESAKRQTWPDTNHLHGCPSENKQYTNSILENDLKDGINEALKKEASDTTRIDRIYLIQIRYSS